MVSRYQKYKESYQRYYQNHKEQIRRSHKKWSEEHREYYQETSKEYRKNNPEKIKAQNKIHGNRNPDKYPLASKCEFCDSTENLEHGHIDYDYPEIYLTVCRRCNIWMDRD